jgi:hypothetical protein
VWEVIQPSPDVKTSLFIIVTASVSLGFSVNEGCKQTVVECYPITAADNSMCVHA